jgi:hypothetical protein
VATTGEPAHSPGPFYYRFKKTFKCMNNQEYQRLRRKRAAEGNPIGHGGPRPYSGPKDDFVAEYKRLCKEAAIKQFKRLRKIAEEGQEKQALRALIFIGEQAAGRATQRHEHDVTGEIFIVRDASEIPDYEAGTEDNQGDGLLPVDPSGDQPESAQVPPVEGEIPVSGGGVESIEDVSGVRRVDNNRGTEVSGQSPPDRKGGVRGPEENDNGNILRHD